MLRPSLSAGDDELFRDEMLLTALPDADVAVMLGQQLIVMDIRPELLVAKVHRSLAA